MRTYRFSAFLSLLLIGCLLAPLSLSAGDGTGLSTGQTIYVPAYSHIYSGNSERPFLLAVTLSIRNIDPANPITILAVDYHDTKGMRLKRYLEAPRALAPLESTRFVVPEKDRAGGSGANFIVQWESAAPVNPPIAESIMIGTQTQQGISFTSRGRVILPTR